jgi:hypothetical protein
LGSSGRGATGRAASEKKAAGNRKKYFTERLYVKYFFPLRPPCGGERSSIHDEAAVDVQDLARDETRLAGGEEEHRLGHLFGRAFGT